jgi:Universal stress protein family
MTGMTDGIIAGYDGSIGSHDALRWAAREAWARGTVLTICLAWPPDDLTVLGDAGLHDRARRSLCCGRWRSAHHGRRC